jgi:hypothetical protein
MPALKAAIFDRIKAGGDVGATSVEIITDIYGDRREVIQVSRESDQRCARRHRFPNPIRRRALAPGQGGDAR